MVSGGFWWIHFLFNFFYFGGGGERWIGRITFLCCIWDTWFGHLTQPQPIERHNNN